MASPSEARTSGLCPGIGFDPPKSVPEGMKFRNALLLAGGIGISRMFLLLNILTITLKYITILIEVQ
jgi:hypothetical protein